MKSSELQFKDERAQLRETDV